MHLRCKVWAKLLNVNAFEVSRNEEKKKGNWDELYLFKLQYQHINSLVLSWANLFLRSQQVSLGDRFIICHKLFS